MWVFEGNTADPTTVAVLIELLKTQFGVTEVVLVGDRGMIKTKGKAALNAEGLPHMHPQFGMGEHARIVALCGQDHVGHGLPHGRQVVCQHRHGYPKQFTPAELRGGQVVVADRFYPSSKMCSACGHKLDDLPLSVREWTCPVCGVVHDRDVNAAVNLKNMAVSSTVSACGEEGAGRARKSAVKPASMKQEASSR